MQYVRRMETQMTLHCVTSIADITIRDYKESGDLMANERSHISHLAPGARDMSQVSASPDIPRHHPMRLCLYIRDKLYQGRTEGDFD